MSRDARKGTCYLCHEAFSKAGMGRHLEKCRQVHMQVEDRQQSKKVRKQKMVQILVDGYYSPEYWMHLQVPAKLELQHIDQFLRNIWLECCGHLSDFKIANQRYVTSNPFDDLGTNKGMFGFDEDKTMRIQLNKILTPGQEFLYDYDFGTTTKLHLKVISAYEGPANDSKITILTRNESPSLLCDCGKPATTICIECMYNGTGLLCDECAKKPTYEYDEGMFLPVVNSPRVGQCAYVGSEA